MKCSNCGYEIDKPNLRTCPLCGYKIVRKFKTEIPSPETVESKIETLPSDQTVVAGVESSSSVQREASEKVLQEPIAPETVECPSCHLRVPADSNFCPHCGYNMHLEQEDSNKQEVPPEPYAEPIQQSELEIEPEPDYINEEESEEQITPSTPENYRVEEDVDEYIENGSYQPYPDEDNIEDETEDDSSKDDSASNSWITIVIVAIISVGIGAVLYNIVY